MWKPDPEGPSAMNFQQLKFVATAVRNGFSLTEVASLLAASQSSVSKQIRELEAELGLDIFIRKGRRLIGLTEAGAGAIPLIERIVEATGNLRRYAGDHVDQEGGRLVVAATSNLAVNVLPRIIGPFSQLYPKVAIELRQGTPAAILKAITDGEADIAIATETVDSSTDLVTFPYFTWKHVAIVPPDHPLAGRDDVTLRDIARYPIVTYDSRLTGRQLIDDSFAKAGVQPDVRLTAMDAAVIGAYVRLGLGVGIIAEMAINEGWRDTVSVISPEISLFPPRIAKVALRRGHIPYSYVYAFLKLLSPHLGRDRIEKMMLNRQRNIRIAVPPWQLYRQELGL